MLHIDGYKNIREDFPGSPIAGGSKKVGRFFGRGKELGGNGEIRCELVDKNSKKKRLADCFVKATHILDPVGYMKGHYDANEEKMRHKINEPMNQAYVDSVASAAVGRLRDAGLSPHFCEMYGAYAAIADKYYYNMSDEYDDFRVKRWFWDNREKGLFDFKVFIGEDREPIPEELKDYFERPVEDEMSDSEDGEERRLPPIEMEDSGCGEGGLEGAEVLDIEGLNISDDGVSVVSIEEFQMSADAHADADAGTGSCAGSCAGADADSKNEKTDEEEEGEGKEEEDEDAEEGQEEIEMYAELPNYPVMLICMERNEDTMDSLLAEEEFEGDWEKRWMAWIFQVVAALCQIQSVYDMTHNDLHTNNILWTSTAEPYLYYKTSDGQMWKVPTYGKLFRIIDFGRAIFTDSDGKLFYSDDFVAGNDAGEQYNFGPIYNDKLPLIEPNRSFDLVRLATGLYEDLYEDEKPERKLGGRYLSREEGLEVWETESKLHDMLWTWLLDDKGENVLIKPNGDERFPGFDLYTHIAAHCHGAVPADQIRAGWFSAFRVEGKKARAIKGKVYPVPLGGKEGQGSQ